MELLIKGILALGIILIISTIGGFILWACWDAFYTSFPALSLPPEISLWTAIKLSWLAGVLFKSSSSAKVEK